MKRKLDDLSQFVAGTKERLNKILEKFDWTEEAICSEPKVHCSVHNDHWVSGLSLEKHEAECSLRKNGNMKDDREQVAPSSQFFYTNASAVHSISIDARKIKQVLSSPQNVTDCASTVEMNEAKSVPDTANQYHPAFTSQDRLKLYDFVVRETANESADVKINDLLVDFEKKSQEKKPKTYIELLAEERDYRRRRQSYRAKNVHDTKKSYTEVMKEVIENQIAYLTEVRKQEEVWSKADEEQ